MSLIPEQTCWPTAAGRKIPAQDVLAREFSSSCIMDTIYFAPFTSQDLLNKQLKINSKAHQLEDSGMMGHPAEETCVEYLRKLTNLDSW